MKRFRKVRLQEAREHTFAIKTNKWTHLSVDSGPRDGNGLSGVGRTRDLPQKVLQDWMAPNLFTKKSAQSIFAAVEAHAAARGYSPREATDLRHQLTPRMITFAAGQVVGKRVVRIKH